jgi:large subunit ribosomal protein L31
MKKNIHPKWYPNCKVICACGNEFTVGATVPEIRVEICSQCHPFFTGEMKFVDTKGRVQKFREKVARAQKLRAVKAKKAKKKQPTEEKTYKEMLREAK